LIIAFGLLLYSKKFANYQHITKYIISIIYGVFTVSLYFTYLFSFLGKTYTSQIITLQIILEYLKSLNEFLNNFSINPILAYTLLLIIPILFFIAILLMTKYINQGILGVNQFIFKHNFNNPEKYTSFNIVLFLLVFAISSLKIYVKYHEIKTAFFVMQEPILSVYFKNYSTFQDQTISNNNNEDIKTRNDYPKDIAFQKKNIIIITVDALRSDHLGLYGYKRKTSPFLDSIYSSGNLKKVELSFSVAGASFAGINGILRSKIWVNMGYDNFSLQQLLKDQGYDINFIISGDHTNFYGLKLFYGKNSDFNYFLDGTTTKKYSDPNDDRIIFEGLDNIYQYNNNPSFFYFHFMSVHALGKKLDNYKTFRPAIWKYDIINYTNRYDNGILQADDYLKHLFKILFEKGYLQNSIVVITADHGEALGERGEFGHVKNVYTDQILIPMLIYDSDNVEYTNMTYATSVDIAPTIVDRLGLPIPESWEGKSLFSETNSEFTFHQMGEDYAIIHSKENFRFKYVYNSKTLAQELFELNSDLYETKNIIDSMEVKYVINLRNQLTSQFRLNPFK
jgi:glucan phosphoethanolaminetransferase (alkaline phosphatase superfamily)